MAVQEIIFCCIILASIEKNHYFLFCDEKCDIIATFIYYNGIVLQTTNTSVIRHIKIDICLVYNGTEMYDYSLHVIYLLFFKMLLT